MFRSITDNSFHSPAVNRLPYEIFMKIIRYAYTTEPKQNDELILYLTLLLPPLAASHVCRSWRYTLLSDPTMWTCLQIPKFKPAGIEELIQRSKPFPLKVLIQLTERTTSVTPASISAIFQYIHRFQLLHVDVHVRRYVWGVYRDISDLKDLNSSIPELLDCLQRPAPELQTFLFRYDHEILPGSRMTSFDTLFSGHAPNLTEVHHGFFADLRELSSPIFHNLSKLVMTWPECFDMQFDRFLDLLELSPCLTLLYICNSHENYSPVLLDSFSGRKINLPHLQWLVLKNCILVDLLDLVLRHVTYPPSVKWHITSRPAQAPPQAIDLHVLAPTILLPDPDAILQLLSKARFTSINIFIKFNSEVELTFSEEHDPSELRVNELGYNKFVYLYDNVSLMKDHWPSLMEHIKPSGITHLHLVFSCSDTSVMLRYSASHDYDFIHSLTSFLLKVTSFTHLRSCTASCWIKDVNQYFDLITEDDLQVDRARVLHDSRL